MTKRALARLDTSPTTSDIPACPVCGGQMTGYAWKRPVCLACKRRRPPPRVVIVRRDPPPVETVTGLRAKLAARNLPRWEDQA